MKSPKFIKDVFKIFLPNKYDVGIVILGLVIGLPTLYLLDTYIYPNFTNKINGNFVMKICIIPLGVLFFLATIFSYLMDKYKIPKGLEEIEKTKAEDSRKIFKVFLNISRFVILVIIIPIIIHTLNQKLNSIRDQDIVLFDVTRNSSNLIPDISVSPIEIKLSWLNRNKLNLCVYNNSKRSLKNGILSIDLPKDCRVIGGETWISTSNQSVYTNLININPNTRLILFPLELEFLESKNYETRYSISGEDFSTTYRKMLIKVLPK